MFTRGSRIFYLFSCFGQFFTVTRKRDICWANKIVCLWVEIQGEYMRNVFPVYVALFNIDMEILPYWWLVQVLSIHYCNLRTLQAVLRDDPVNIKRILSKLKRANCKTMNNKTYYFIMLITNYVHLPKNQHHLPHLTELHHWSWLWCLWFDQTEISRMHYFLPT